MPATSTRVRAGIDQAAATRRALARYQLSSPDPFMIHRAVKRRKEVVDFEFEYLNPAAAELFGATLKGLRGSLLVSSFPHLAHDPLVFERYVSVLQRRLFEEAEVPHPLGIKQRKLRRRLVGLSEGRLCVCFHDISGNLNEVNQLSLVSQALEHRLGGQFALVQALCNHALSHARDLAEFKASFPRRIAALASAESLLRPARQQVALRALFEDVLQPFGIPPSCLSGDDNLRVKSDSLAALTVAVHELASSTLNGVDGALAGERIAVRWRANAERVHIHWMERLSGKAGHAGRPAAASCSLVTSAVESLGRGQLRFWCTAECSHCFIEFDR